MVSIAMIDVRHLRAFIAVAEELNFHRAASRLGTVQPALSRLIKNLEEQAGVRLLERNTRHVLLTEAGKTFLTEARALMGQLTAAVQKAQHTARGTAGLLRLAYMDFAVHRILPEMLLAVHKSEPGIEVDLIYMPTAQQRLALIEDRIDIGIMIGGISAPAVESVTIAEEPFVVVLPRKHRLAGLGKLTVSDLIDQPILIGNVSEWSAFRDAVFDLFAAEGAAARIAHQASSATALLGLASKGLGLVLYAGEPRLYQGGGLVYRRIATKRRLPIAIAWRKGLRLPLIRRFLGAALPKP